MANGRPCADPTVVVGGEVLVQPTIEELCRPPATMTIGRTLVVAPGSLAEGSYAVADLHARSAEIGELSAPSR